jgi:hypothetical protein
MIDIHKFKEMIVTKFPNSVLSVVLSVEPDELTEQEFEAKALTYLKLSHFK